MKKIVVLALSASVALIAGKDVIPAPSEPLPVVPATPALESLTSHGIGLKIGTLGIGVDFEHYFNKKHALRLNPNYFKYTKDNKEIRGITYDAELKLQNVGLLYDYHPWGTSFRLSTGVYYNKNKLTATAKPSSTKVYTIGDRKYKLDSKAEIDAKIDFKKVAPYVGIGWSSPEKEGWHLIADIGVMYVGSPKVNYQLKQNNGEIYDVTNGEPGVKVADVNNDPRVKEALDKERQEIYDKMKKYKWWPVISIGIQKKF